MSNEDSFDLNTLEKAVEHRFLTRIEVSMLIAKARAYGHALTAAKALWSLLDDIDTLGDSMKPEITPYFKKVEEIHKKRHAIMRSDGYEVYLSEIESFTRDAATNTLTTAPGTFRPKRKPERVVELGRRVAAFEAAAIVTYDMGLRCLLCGAIVETEDGTDPIPHAGACPMHQERYG